MRSQMLSVGKHPIAGIHFPAFIHLAMNNNKAIPPFQLLLADVEIIQTGTEISEPESPTQECHSEDGEQNNAAVQPDAA